MQPRVGGEEMEMEGQQVQNLNFHNNNQSYSFGSDQISVICSGGSKSAKNRNKMASQRKRVK